MRFPYIRNYQQSSGWQPPNENHCQHGGEWKWQSRWGKKQGYKFWAFMIMSTMPMALFLSFYGKYSWKRQKYEEYMRIREHLISTGASKEQLEEYEDMYRGYTTEEEVSVWNRLFGTFTDKGIGADEFGHSADYLKYFLDDGDKAK